MYLIWHPFKPGHVLECYDDEESRIPHRAINFQETAMPRKAAAKPASDTPQSLPSEPVQSVDVTSEVGHLDRAITTALNAAVAGGLPKGYIVAVLHAHALKQTQQLLG
jgi:hypothetical protein